MWPMMLDMTRDECKQRLRRLAELEAYGSLVSALRAQGVLSSDKRKLLEELANTLNISQERHRAEVRRAVNDEKLYTIAHAICGEHTTDDWALEGRRLIPLMPRLVPQTLYTPIADEAADKANLLNEKLPLPANTERKRQFQPAVFSEAIKVATTEDYEQNLEEAHKKRKSSMSDNISLSHHLIMAPPKISKVQQIYRQKTKAMMKAHMKAKASSIPIQPSTSNQRPKDEEPSNKVVIQAEVHKSSPKTLPKISSSEPVKTVATSTVPDSNLKSRLQQIMPIKPITTTSFKLPQTPSTSQDNPQKSIKVCPARKVITNRSQISPQKVIIVTNSQTPVSTSILQRTLTVPFIKNVPVKNFEKVKILSNTLLSTPASPDIASNGTSTVVVSKPKLLSLQPAKARSSMGKSISIPVLQGVQLQSISGKGNVKMLPLSANAKIISKTGIVNVTSSSPIYIMNTTASLPTITRPMIAPKLERKDEPSTTDETPKLREIEAEQKEEPKSSVLAEILKASGVLTADGTEDQNDIESQISQLTEIPRPVTAETVEQPSISSFGVDSSFSGNENLKVETPTDSGVVNESSYLILESNLNESNPVLEEYEEPSTSTTELTTVDSVAPDRVSSNEEKTYVLELHTGEIDMPPLDTD